MRTAPSSPAPSAESTPSVARGFRERPISTLLATGFGVGLAPHAPGTAGSALALALAYGAIRLLHPSHTPSIAAAVGLLASGLAVALVGVPITERASRAMGSKDPAAIVWDELAGQLIACSAVPLFAYATAARGAGAWLGSFLAFRIFDVWKPGFVRRLQDLPGGLGIMADDVVAGVLAGVLTVLIGGALSG